MNSGERIVAGSPAHLPCTARMNTGYRTPETLAVDFAELTARSVPEGFGPFPPFYTDCGKNIHLGKQVFINSGCRFQDQGGIVIGDDALIGHNCVIAMLNHAEDPARRGDMFPCSVTIEDHVWIGANATLCPGVTIGEGAIVAAGAGAAGGVPGGSGWIGIIICQESRLVEERF
ncbi:DapH/DapD/GlmU-related protein [Pseudoramibacter sp. HA2172]|uniref:DapH/DapD/GlmU-related protein n=1 Tax=Pseudoramibacter faecis TaxID=3108534 RepID=UPI002E7796D0|nr:DapH/DapD/GlmU-related protein [Pseudoramibacter sp. HA2172]